MITFDVLIVAKQPVDKEVLSAGTIRREDEKTITIDLGVQNDMESALGVKNSGVERLKERGVNILGTWIFPSKRERE